ncbi:MAG: hypothetical protein CM15mP93_14780 [Thiotrichaceae bacterium]|nr:MAG: hypothetical protein CM15mP93_14780 [Thiotrichaceae bacterium]
MHKNLSNAYLSSPLKFFETASYKDIFSSYGFTISSVDLRYEVLPPISSI